MRKPLIVILFFTLSANIFGQDFRFDQMNFWTNLTVQNLEVVNSEHEEFSPYIWSDYLVYVGIQEKTGIFKKNQPNYFDLKASLLNPENTLPKFVFSNELNSQFHEGPISWDQSNNKLYFTRASSENGQAIVDKSGRQQLLIYQADYAQGKWSNIVPLHLGIEMKEETKTETFCHPAIYDNGNKIIFASPKIGGMGKMDLYTSEKMNNDKWSTPRNLGDQINKNGNQWFPFVLNNEHLFYASDVGDGQGLDIYYAKLDENGQVGTSQRLPFPINTSYDDFGLIFSENVKRAYFSSNRPDGKGKDDIYLIHLK